MRKPIRVDLTYPRVDGNATEIIVELVDVRAANTIAISYDFARDGWSISSDMSDPDHPELAPPGPSEVAFVDAGPQPVDDSQDRTTSALRELAEHGLRFDLNPTMAITTADEVYAQWAAYARRMDEAVRTHAREALAVTDHTNGGI